MDVDPLGERAAVAWRSCIRGELHLGCRVSASSIARVLRANGRHEDLVVDNHGPVRAVPWSSERQDLLG